MKYIVRGETFDEAKKVAKHLAELIGFDWFKGYVLENDAFGNIEYVGEDDREEKFEAYFKSKKALIDCKNWYDEEVIPDIIRSLENKKSGDVYDSYAIEVICKE